MQHFAVRLVTLCWQPIVFPFSDVGSTVISERTELVVGLHCGIDLIYRVSVLQHTEEMTPSPVQAANGCLVFCPADGNSPRYVHGPARSQSFASSRVAGRGRRCTCVVLRLAVMWPVKKEAQAASGNPWHVSFFGLGTQRMSQVTSPLRALFRERSPLYFRVNWHSMM